MAVSPVGCTPLAAVLWTWCSTVLDHRIRPLLPAGVERANCCYGARMVRMRKARAPKAKMVASLDQAAGKADGAITQGGGAVARALPATGPHYLRDSLVGVAVTRDEHDELFTTGQVWGEDDGPP